MTSNEIFEFANSKNPYIRLHIICYEVFIRYSSTSGDFTYEKHALSDDLKEHVPIDVKLIVDNEEALYILIKHDILRQIRPIDYHDGHDGEAMSTVFLTLIPDDCNLDCKYTESIMFTDKFCSNPKHKGTKDDLQHEERFLSALKEFVKVMRSLKVVNYKIA